MPLVAVGWHDTPPTLDVEAHLVEYHGMPEAVCASLRADHVDLVRAHQADHVRAAQGRTRLFVDHWHTSDLAVLGERWQVRREQTDEDDDAALPGV